MGNWDWIQIKIWFFHHKTNSSTNLSKSNWMNIINEFIFDSSINFCWASPSTGIQNDSPHCIINFLESSFFFISYLFLVLTFTLFFSSQSKCFWFLMRLYCAYACNRCWYFLSNALRIIPFFSLFLSFSLYFIFFLFLLTKLCCCTLYLALRIPIVLLWFSRGLYTYV